MGAMQEIELLLLSAGILVAVAYIATQVVRRPTDHPIGRVLLGLVPAVIAVALILFARLDVVPDDVEQPAWIVAIVLVSGILIVGTTWRLSRR
jgi:drug/metabolite transporter (DMT)-like permease